MLLSGCGQDKNTGADNVTGIPGANGGTQAPSASDENPDGSSSGTSNVGPDGSGPSDAFGGGTAAPNGGAFGSGPSSDPSGSSFVQAASAAVSTLSTERMFTDRDSRSTWDAAAVAVSLLGSSAECASDKVSVSGGTVTITGEGSYLLSGTLDDGMIIVDVDKTEKVQLVLNGVTIRNSDSAAVYVRSADKVFITLAAGTSNVLGNGGVYTAIDDNNIDAVIFSKDDLSLNGSGSLVVEAAAGHGIVSKNDLVIAEGSYTISAASHGICGKDSVRIAGGSLAVTSDKDGIHADNDEAAESNTVGLVIELLRVNLIKMI